MLLRKLDKGSDVTKLQQGLEALGFSPGKIDGVFGQRTEDALEAFQKAQKIYPDGVFGPITVTAWNAALVAQPALQFKLDVDNTGNVEPSKRFALVKCVADPLNGGYSHLTLREDIAAKFNSLRAEVKSFGGNVTTAGGRRALNSGAGAARSKTSFHYTARAFDLAVYSGMQDPNKDAFVVTRDPNSARRFIVWAKAPHGQTQELKALVARQYRDSKGVRKTELTERTWSGPVVNFTELAKKHGFSSIGARSDFLKGGGYAGAEWWHFQNEEGLVLGVSKFGDELLKVYTLAQCEKFLYWTETRNLTFGQWR